MKLGRMKLAALLSVYLALASCRDGTPMGPASPELGGPELAKGQHHKRRGLLDCRPLASDSVSKSVGPRGATLRVSGHLLSIPPRALRHATRITLVVPADTVNRIRLEPHGLEFDKPVALTMSYANCAVETSTDPRRIAYTNESLEILAYEPSVDDAVGTRVTGQLKHFSQYAVSW